MFQRDASSIRDAYLDAAQEAATRVKDPETISLIEKFRQSSGSSVGGLRSKTFETEKSLEDESSEDWDAEFDEDGTFQK